MSAVGLVYVCAGVLGGGRDVGYPRLGLTGGCELLGDRTQVLCKSIRALNPQAISLTQI